MSALLCAATIGVSSASAAARPVPTSAVAQSPQAQAIERAEALGGTTFLYDPSTHTWTQIGAGASPSSQAASGAVGSLGAEAAAGAGGVAKAACVIVLSVCNNFVSTGQDSFNFPTARGANFEQIDLLDRATAAERKAVSDAIHGANDAVNRPAILEDPPAETLGSGDAAASEGSGVVEIIEDVVVWTIL
jgi:hypothetical protein